MGQNLRLGQSLRPPLILVEKLFLEWNSVCGSNTFSLEFAEICHIVLGCRILAGSSIRDYFLIHGSNSMNLSPRFSMYILIQKKQYRCFNSYAFHPPRAFVSDKSMQSPTGIHCSKADLKQQPLLNSLGKDKLALSYSIYFRSGQTNNQWNFSMQEPIQRYFLGLRTILVTQQKYWCCTGNIGIVSTWDPAHQNRIGWSVTIPSSHVILLVLLGFSW